MNNAETSAYYADRLAKHGSRPAAVDVTIEGQRLRFGVLLSTLGDAGMYIGNRCSVLDVGCGYGAFADFLIENSRWSAKYKGVDICPKMIEAAQDRRPNTNFEVRDIVENPLPKKFDFVLASGLFQFATNLHVVKELICAMWDHAGGVLAFNMLSSKTPEAARAEREFYAAPHEIFEYCQYLTPFVTLRHDYRENDFTVVMFRASPYAAASLEVMAA